MSIQTASAFYTIVMKVHIFFFLSLVLWFCRVGFFLSFVNFGCALQTADIQFTPHIFWRYCQKVENIVLRLLTRSTLYYIFYPLFLSECVFVLCVCVFFFLASSLFCVILALAKPFVIQLYETLIVCRQSWKLHSSTNGWAEKEGKKCLYVHIYINIYRLYIYTSHQSNEAIVSKITFRKCVCHWRIRWMSFGVAHILNALKMRFGNNQLVSFGIFLCFLHCFHSFSQPKFGLLFGSITNFEGRILWKILVD